MESFGRCESAKMVWRYIGSGRFEDSLQDYQEIGLGWWLRIYSYGREMLSR